LSRAAPRDRVPKRRKVSSPTSPEIGRSGDKDVKFEYVGDDDDQGNGGFGFDDDDDFDGNEDLGGLESDMGDDPYGTGQGFDGDAAAVAAAADPQKIGDASGASKRRKVPTSSSKCLQALRAMGLTASRTVYFFADIEPSAEAKQEEENESESDGVEEEAKRIPRSTIYAQDAARAFHALLECANGPNATVNLVQNNAWGHISCVLRA
jgi:hypothetical protein